MSAKRSDQRRVTAKLEREGDGSPILRTPAEPKRPEKASMSNEGAEVQSIGLGRAVEMAGTAAQCFRNVRDRARPRIEASIRTWTADDPNGGSYQR